MMACTCIQCMCMPFHLSVESYLHLLLIGFTKFNTKLCHKHATPVSSNQK